MIKTIFILWFQGFDNAPIIVKKCVDSWKHYNPDWNIILLDHTNLCKYIDLDFYYVLNKKILKNAT
jgi:mannosyltransferase OCH1-like enzyme